MTRADSPFSAFTGPRRVPHVRQVEVAECGLACLAMVAGYHGLHLDMNAMRRRHATSLRGTTLKNLIAMADAHGFSCRPVKLPLKAVADLQMPAILHWDMNHYVVIERFIRGQAVIYDPGLGAAQRLTMADLSERFTGVALELRPAPDFKAGDQRQPLRIDQLWSGVSGWKRAAAQTIILTIIMQLYVLISPYYMQISIDSALPALDRNLMTVLAFGFALFAVVNAGASLLRGFVLMSAGATVGFTLSGNVGRRLFRLPIDWFERRHVGDVLSRFQSLRPVQEALTQGVIASLVDGTLIIATIIVMFWYSINLAMISLSALLLYLIVRMVSFGFEKRAREGAIVAAAREQSTLIESIRGILPLRLFGRETERHIIWQNRLLDSTSANLSISRISLWQQSANALIFGLENVAILWAATTLVMGGGFSVGMIFAYITYKQQFISRSTALVDQVIAFRMLRLHLQRVGDIALEAEDAGFSSDAGTKRVFQGELELRCVNYRYSASDPLVLNQASIRIPAGAHVAITGVSGGGKSTLAKILLGIADPESGDFLIDGQSLSQFGHRAYRAQVAAVLQQDHLFAGTIADNIALFDDNAAFDDVVRAAKLAAIDAEISRMPMQYETLVGDMGSVLSGGQKARILLARALYRRPQLLLLDEGTAHLDAETEIMVNEAVSKLGMTRIVIAHRSETIRNADIVYVVRNGEIALRSV